MRIRKASLYSLVSLVALSVSCAMLKDHDGSLHPRLILHGGKVWTGSSDLEEVEAVAIQGNRIAAVGTDAQILALRGPDTQLIDLKGRLVVPGFIDSHVHFLSGGDELLAPDLRSARSEDEFAQRLGEFAASLPPGTWITSGAWDHENWPAAQLPTRQTLDRYTPDHPVFVSRLDGHMAVANSLALRLAGITRETRDPPGGQIVRDADRGEPAGVLKDTAMDLVSRHVPSWTAAQRLERGRAALRHAASLGVTGVHDMLGSFVALETYQTLRDSGELTTRVTVYTPIAEHKRWTALGVRRGFGDERLKVNGVKGFADGSLGSSTALFFEEYVDSPGTRGLALADLSPAGDFEKAVVSCTDAGLQVVVHGIGDRAIRSLLDIYGRVETTNPGRHRFRIEHSQHIHPDDLPLFAERGVIASMQPYHAIDDGRWAEKRIGKKRCRTTYAFRELLRNDTVLAFGSDWPVAPLSPLLGIYAAVSRRTLDGEHPDGWIPEQKIRVNEALRAYTWGSAFAAFDESQLGTIEPGKLADMVVLDTDILAEDLTDPDVIRQAQVDVTLVGGELVYDRRESSSVRTQ